jgi:hypothetical protein
VLLLGSSRFRSSRTDENKKFEEPCAKPNSTPADEKKQRAAVAVRKPAYVT